MNLIDIRPERWERLCSHPLNPLKYCLESVRLEFMELAANYKLLSEALRNAILNGPAQKTVALKRKRKSSAICTPATVEKERLKGGVGGLGRGSNPLDSFFPFDPYLLRQSHDFIEPLYRHWDESAVANLPSVGEDDDKDIEQEDDHDALESVEDDEYENEDEDESLADPEMDDVEDDSSIEDETTSNYTMSYTSKVDGFDDASPAVQVQLEGDWTAGMGRPRAPSIENGSW